MRGDKRGLDTHCVIAAPTPGSRSTHTQPHVHGLGSTLGGTVTTEAVPGWYTGPTTLAAETIATSSDSTCRISTGCV
jgi:hypothetical protein